MIRSGRNGAPNSSDRRRICSDIVKRWDRQLFAVAGDEVYDQNIGKPFQQHWYPETLGRRKEGKVDLLHRLDYGIIGG